jgi:hypothetical protein
VSRKTDLEGSIRDSYGIIRDYELQIQVEDRPEVKMRAQRSIDQQWAHIEEYWSEYRPLAGGGVPDDIAQIVARFEPAVPGSYVAARPLAPPADMYETRHLTALRELIIDRLNVQDVRFLCADLGADYENLGGEGKAGKVLSLVDHVRRRRCFPELLVVGRKLRPDVDWEGVFRQEAGSPSSTGPSPRSARQPPALSALGVDLLRILQDPDDHEGYTAADLERIFGQPKSKLRYNLETLIDRGMSGRSGSPNRYYRLPPGLAYLIENDRPVHGPPPVKPDQGAPGPANLSTSEERRVKAILNRWAARAPRRLGSDGYMAILIDDTNWPDEVKTLRTQALEGFSESDARELINAVLPPQTNPVDKRYTFVGDLLSALTRRADLGLQDKEYLAALIAARDLVDESAFGDLELPVPRWVDVAQPDVGPDLEWQGPTDDLVLEGYLRPEPNPLDMGWLRRVVQRAESVCLIQYCTPQGQERPSGTGFLIGGGLVLTNYHVLQDPRFPGDVLLENVPQARLYFGQVTVEGGEVTRGREFEPVGGVGAVLASSPVKELDYVLLRVEPADAQTGWQGIRPAPYTLELPDEREGLHIIGHPVIGSAEAEEGVPMMLAQSGSGVTWVSEAKGKLQYWTRSAGGSSGSPCFNDSLQLVALHHARRSKSFGSRGEGILFKAIHDEIAQFL